MVPRILNLKIATKRKPKRKFFVEPFAKFI